AAAELHGLSVAMGSAVHLGGDRGFEHGTGDAVARARRPIPRTGRCESHLRCTRLPVRRRRNWPPYVIALLHSTLHFLPVGGQLVHGRALLADPARRIVRTAGVSAGRGSSGARPMRVLTLPILMALVIWLLYWLARPRQHDGR